LTAGMREWRPDEGGASLPDTHAHLDDPAFEGDLDAVIRRALDAGVDRVLAVGQDLESSKRALAIARKYEMVYAGVGVHPHRAAQFNREAEPLRALLDEERVVAVGEIGLDYVRGTAPRELQVRVFQEQLVWAERLSLPVSVHSRDAEEDLLASLHGHRGSVVLHCFSGSQEFAGAAIRAGYYLSFAGNVTFPRADELRALLPLVPHDRLLVETDSPVLAPQPRRGRRNEPANVVYAVQVMAERLDMSRDVLTRNIAHNADHVFGWRTA